LVGDQDFRTQRILDMHAAPEALLDVRLANLLHALVGAIEDDLDTAVLDPGLEEQITQSHAAPARISDQALKEIRVVAAALEAGVDLDLVEAFQLRERHFDRPLDHAGDAQPIALFRNLRLAVMLDDVEVADRRVKALDVAGIEKVNRPRRHGRRRESFGDVRERHEHLVLRERKLRPERHPRRRRQPAGYEAAPQKVSPCEALLRRHHSSPFVAFFRFASRGRDRLRRLRLAPRAAASPAALARPASSSGLPDTRRRPPALAYL